MGGKHRRVAPPTSHRRTGGHEQRPVEQSQPMRAVRSARWDAAPEHGTRPLPAQGPWSWLPRASEPSVFQFVSGLGAS